MNVANHHFKELMSLFEAYIPRFPTLSFDIKGDHTCFTLKKVHGYPYLYAGLFALLFLLPSLIMIPSNISNFRFWLVEVFILGVAWIIFNLIVASRSITVDSNRKSIVLERSTILRKPANKPLLIQFHQYKAFTSQEITKNVSKFGQKVAYQRIFILYNEEKLFLMDIPGDFQQGKDNTFLIQSLDAIIKNG